MREIKFRAWDRTNTSIGLRGGRMFQNSYCVIDGDWCVNHRYTNECETGRKLDLVHMQYTGLKDKNGVEIYEGDIIRGDRYPFWDKREPNYVAVVEWIFAGFQYVYYCINPKKRGISDGINNILESGEDFEIIGNIYEHKHLLK